MGRLKMSLIVVILISMFSSCVVYVPGGRGRGHRGYYGSGSGHYRHGGYGHGHRGGNYW